MFFPKVILVFGFIFTSIYSITAVYMGRVVETIFLK